MNRYIHLQHKQILGWSEILYTLPSNMHVRNIVLLNKGTYMDQMLAKTMQLDKYNKEN